MTDLTRDEIRSACEAVPGWKWIEEGFQAFAQHMTEEGEIEYFLITETPEGGVVIDYHDCDGIALLEATGERWQCGRSIGKEEPYFALIPGQPHAFGPDLTTAAVRAVNQRAKAKKETTP